MREWQKKTHFFFLGTLNENGQYLLKACNLVVSKSLDHANRTSSLCVLLQLLRGCSKDDKSSTFSDFVMKCLMKLTMELKDTHEMVDFKYILKGLFCLMLGWILTHTIIKQKFTIFWLLSLLSTGNLPLMPPPSK